MRPTLRSVLPSTGGTRLGPAQLALARRPPRSWLQTLHPSLVRGLPATPSVSWGGWWLCDLAKPPGPQGWRDRGPQEASQGSVRGDCSRGRKLLSGRVKDTPRTPDVPLTTASETEVADRGGWPLEQSRGAMLTAHDRLPDPVPDTVELRLHVPASRQHPAGKRHRETGSRPLGSDRGLEMQTGGHSSVHCPTPGCRAPPRRRPAAPLRGIGKVPGRPV